MKYLVKSLALACCLSTALSAPSIAADADIDVLLEPESTFVEVGSGWYLRGDITASVNGARINNEFSTSTGSTSPLSTNENFRDMIGFDIGAGYRFTNNFRADVTLAHFLSGERESTREVPDAEKATECPGYLIDPGSGSLVGVTIDNCSFYSLSDYNTFSLMGTGYFDLNPIGKFEPFVGAGLGIARVRWSEVVDGVICAPLADGVVVSGCSGNGGDQPEPNTVYKSGGTIAAGVDYRLAYSLTAGFAYRLSRNLLLDASYKYTGVGHTMGITSGDTKAQSTAKNGFGLHQINVGFRYEIW